MKVKLNSKTIIKNILKEEQLSDYSEIESLFHIRKVKAAIESKDQGFIEVDDEIKNGQVKSNDYRIWLQEGEYELV